MKDSHIRSIAKGVTWRFIASATTMTIVYIMTGSIELVAAVGAADILAKIGFYYMHERIWGKVHWGRFGTEPKFASCPCDCHTVESVQTS